MTDTMTQPFSQLGPTGGYNTTWTVDPNQLVQNQITGLLASNNPYITNARAQGSQLASSRGFLNGTMAAGASENAAINAALPIASADASMYGKAAETNATNATQQDIERQRAAAQLGAAGISASAQRYGDDIRFQMGQNQLAQSANEYNANWAHQQAMRGWNLQDQQNAQQYTTRNAIMGTMLGVFANDPSSFMSSSDGGQGMMNFYNTNFANLFGSNSTGANMGFTPLPDGYGTVPIPTNNGYGQYP